MYYASIYKNGKPAYFFLNAETPEEFAVIQPYFLVTSFDKPRRGRILEMNCLFSGSVWFGRQRHGYGYSPSADAYGELFDIIRKLHADKLTDEDKAALDAINTHNDRVTFPADFLKRLDGYNTEELTKKYN